DQGRSQSQTFTPDQENDRRHGHKQRSSCNYWIPIITTATSFMAMPAVVLLVRRKRLALAPALVALLTFLMATALSKPIWDALPALQETQFPWRWLTITSASLSILVAISLPELVRMWRTRLRPRSEEHTSELQSPC